MLDMRCRRLLLAASFVLASSSCTPTGADETAPTGLVAVAGGAALGHEFLRLTDAEPDLFPKLYVNEALSVDNRFEFVLDELGNYYVGGGSRVLAIDGRAANPSVRTLELLPTRPTLLGIHGEDLIVFGTDPTGCGTCVFRLASNGEGPLRPVAPFDAEGFDPVMVGDHVAALVYGRDLMTLSLADGEVRRTPLETSPNFYGVAAAGDRLLWGSTKYEADDQFRSILHQSRAPFDTIEVVFQLEGTHDTEQLLDIAWVGDAMLYMVGYGVPHPGHTVKLYRRIGDQTELLMDDLKLSARLVNDAGSTGLAWLVVQKKNDVNTNKHTGLPRPPPRETAELWRIGLDEHVEVPFPSAAKLITGTRSGLAWVQEFDQTVSFHLAGAGPDGFVAPEAPAGILD